MYVKEAEPPSPGKSGNLRGAGLPEPCPGSAISIKPAFSPPPPPPAPPPLTFLSIHWLPKSLVSTSRLFPTQNFYSFEKMKGTDADGHT